MSNEVDFELEVSKKLKENIKEVHKDIKSPSMQIKILNYSKKYQLESNYVEQLIIDDINFAMGFAKDPGRQSIHENIAAKHIESLDVVDQYGSFIKLPSSGKNAKYVTSNGVKHENEDNVKSIDFEIKIEEKTIYATCKYTKDEGGAQDNQYADVQEYVRAVVNMSTQGNAEDNEYFIVIVDGEYYAKAGRKEALSQAGLGTIPILSVNDVEEYLINLLLITRH